MRGTIEDNSVPGRLSRREALARVACAGIGIAAAVAGAGELMDLRAQAGLPDVIPPAPDKNSPQVPSWKTQFKKLAPDVYVYLQGGRPRHSHPRTFKRLRDRAGRSSHGDRCSAGALADESFIAAAKRATGKPFARLVNSHHHVDHVGGNQWFGPIEIMGHPYCRQEVLKTVATTPHKWDKREGWADGTEERKVVPPVNTFENKWTTYEGTPVEFTYVGPAHTWGDLVAYLPERKILIAADLAFFYVVPFAHNGHVTKWIEAIDKALAMDVQTIVPGHGPIGGKKELAETGEYFRLLKKEARKRYDAGLSAGKAAAEVRLGRFDNWLGTERIVMNTVRLYDEFKGVITPDINYVSIKQAAAEYNAIKSGGAKHS